MSNPAAPIGLTYRGTDLQEATVGIFLEIKRGLNETYEVRGVDTVVPSLAYRIARNRIADRMPIELEGYVLGSGSTESDARADFRSSVNTLRALFDPELAPGDLVATLEDGSTATISARALPGLLFDQFAPSGARLNVELEGLEDWDIAVGS